MRLVMAFCMWLWHHDGTNEGHRNGTTNPFLGWRCCDSSVDQPCAVPVTQPIRRASGAWLSKRLSDSGRSLASVRPDLRGVFTSLLLILCTHLYLAVCTPEIMQK